MNKSFLPENLFPGDVLLLGKQMDYPAGTKAKIRREASEIGRELLASGLRQLGAQELSISKGERGNLILPDHFLGSLSHSGNIVIAAVTSSLRYRSIGVDVQEWRETDPDRLAKRICTAAELEWVRKESDLLKTVLTVFAAKESLYKACSPILNRYIGFQEMSLRWCASSELIGIPSKGYDFNKLLDPLIVRIEWQDGFVFAATVF